MHLIYIYAHVYNASILTSINFLLMHFTRFRCVCIKMRSSVCIVYEKWFALYNTCKFFPDPNTSASPIVLNYYSDSSVSECEMHRYVILCCWYIKYFHVPIHMMLRSKCVDFSFLSFARENGMSQTEELIYFRLL